MALSGKLLADFTSFYDAVQKAEVQLKAFESGAGKVQSALTRMTDTFSGRKVIQDATLATQAVANLGGVSKLTANEQATLGAKVSEALEKFKAMGIEAPAAIRKIDQELHAASQTTGILGGALQRVGEYAAGFVTAQALIAGFKTAVRAAADEVRFLTTEGASIADVSDNFDHLTQQAGRLGSTLLGSLREGTRGTVNNLELIKLANQDLAAGLKLTDEQFSTLAKGAFALAQATGTDVTQGLQTMNDAMVTGRARAIALLTGKIDLAEAERRYAATLGTTADHLSEEGKLYADRQAILKAVADATERLGAQTDGLDEKIAQAKVGWQNFHNELAKTVATSPTLIAGFDALRAAMTQVFGSDQQAQIRRIADLIDAVAIATVGFAEYAVRAGGFVVKEWYAVYKIVGDLAQVLDLAILGFKGLSLAAAEAGSLGGRLGPMVGDVARIQSEIDGITARIRERGTALKEADAAQRDANTIEQDLVARLADVQAAMVRARAETTAFVGPLQTAAGATARFNEAAKRSSDVLVNSEADLKKWREAWEEVSSAGKGVDATIASIDGKVADFVRGALKDGVISQSALATVFGLTAAQVKALSAELERHDAILKVESVSANRAAEGLERLGTTPMPDPKPLGEAAKRIFEFEQGINGASGALEKLGIRYEALGPKEEAALKHHQEFVKSVDSLTAAFAQLAQVSGGTFGGIVRDIGNVIASINLANKAVDIFEQAIVDKNKTGMIAGLIGGASAVAQATAAGSILGRAAGGALTGALVGSVAGPLGSAIGAIAGGLTGLFRGLFGSAEKQINPIREALVQAAGGSDELNRRAAAAGITLNHLFDARNPEAYQKAIEELNAAFQFQDSAMQTLDQTIQKYGFDLADLPGNLQTAKFQEWAGSLLQDYRLLISAGVEQGNVVTHMQDAFNELIKKSLQTGQAIPEDLKPAIQRMIDMGLAVDESGNKITDIGQLTFAKPLTEQFQTLLEKIEKLIDAIGRGIPDAVRNLPKTIDINANVHVNTPPPLGPGGEAPEGSGPGGLPSGGAFGGWVTPHGIQAFGTGGKVLPFMARGSDTVPAMLTPGEMVLTVAQQERLAAGISGGSVVININVAGSVLTERDLGTLVQRQQDAAMRRRRRVGAA